MLLGNRQKLIQASKIEIIEMVDSHKSNRKAMNRNWSNQKANPTLKTKTGIKEILQIDKIQWEQIANRAGSHFLNVPQSK